MEQELGFSGATIVKIIKSLVEDGFIIPVYSDQTGTTYKIPLYDEITTITKEEKVVYTDVDAIIENKKNKANDKILTKDIKNNKIPEHFIKFRKFIFEVWAPTYPKKTSRIKLEAAIDEFIKLKLTLTHDEFVVMLNKIKEHTKMYIKETETRYLKDPCNYFLENKFEEPLLKPKQTSTVMNKGFNSDMQKFETPDEIQKLLRS